MRRSIIASIVVFLAFGCDRFGDPGLQISAIVPPTSAECVLNDDPDIRLTRGIWDLDFESPYFVAPIVNSLLVDNSIDIQADRMSLNITGLEIQLLLPDGTKVPLPDVFNNPYSVTTSGFLPSSDGSTAVSVVVLAEGIPVSYQSALRALLPPAPAVTDTAEILIEMKAFGSTTGGLGVTSPAFLWPVQLCAGCLSGCFFIDPGTGGSDGGGGGTICTPGQDGDPYPCIP